MSNDILFATEEQQAAMNAGQTEDTIEVDSEKYLLFLSDNLKLGVSAEYVVEIITNYMITYLPMVPDFVRGIINLRGQIIPIVDVRLRLGKETIADSLVIVLNVKGTLVGILVDSVDQMVDIPKDILFPMPANSVQQLVSGMCSLPNDGSTMMVLDCDQLMPHEL